MKKAVLVLAVCAVCVTAACGSPGQDEPDVTVATGSGVLRGEVVGESRRFQGIPYAAPPVGDLRWHAPEPPAPWRGVRQATRPGNLCPQEPTPYADVGSTTEDCLFLNVTAPRTGTDKPVIVWIHGDGVVGGGHLFDPRALVETGDVVAVTINYRLGVFGAFGHPELPGSGTFGLQDQQAALRWVRDEIAGFGGDPGNVTIMGESYGAQSVSAHLMAPDSKPLFHKAIMQSPMTLLDMPAGSLMPDLPAGEWLAWRSVEEVRGVGAAMAGQVGCADLACLRELPVKELFPLMRPFQAMAFGGEVLPHAPDEAFRDGAAQGAGRSRVPVLMGTTRDEHRVFVGLFYDLAGAPVTAEQYPRLLATAFGDLAPAVEQRYPLADYPSPSVAWAAVLTDRMWALGTNRLAGVLADDALWVYEFADREAPAYLPFPDNFPPGAFHAADVPYLFPDKEFTGSAALSDRMIRYWTAFAAHGDPNSEGMPEWPAYTSTDGPVVSLAPDGVRPARFVEDHQLEFWRAHH